MQNYRGWLPNRKSAYPGTGYPGRNPTRCPRTVNSPNNCPPFDADNSLVVLLSGTKILSAFKRGGSLDDFTVPNNCHRYVVCNKPIALILVIVLLPGGSLPRYPVCAVPRVPWYPVCAYPGTKPHSCTIGEEIAKLQRLASKQEVRVPWYRVPG